MLKLIIMRGPSGSGKSTFVSKLTDPPAFVCSADAYFVRHDGEYHFDVTKIGDAHKWCMREFLDAVGRREPCIVIDNTNLEAWEISPYYMVGLAHDYDVTIVQILAPSPEIAAERNLHGVPAGKILKDFERMGRISLPRHWVREFVQGG